jgi:hypothetical protein
MEPTFGVGALLWKATPVLWTRWRCRNWDGDGLSFWEAAAEPRRRRASALPIGPRSHSPRRRTFRSRDRCTAVPGCGAGLRRASLPLVWQCRKRRWRFRDENGPVIAKAKPRLRARYGPGPGNRRWTSLGLRELAAKPRRRGASSAAGQLERRTSLSCRTGKQLKSRTRHLA